MHRSFAVGFALLPLTATSASWLWNGFLWLSVVLALISGWEYLSRAVVGVRGRCLIVNLPGSPKGALESLEAIVPVLDHALETLAGPYDHAITAPGGQEEGR